MKVRHPGPAAAIVAVTLTLAAIPLAQAVTDTSSASVAHPRVVFRPGTVPDTFRIVPRPRTPLALISVTSGNGQDYTVVSSGTDFSDSTVWRRMGAGTLCWTERPTRATRKYSVREAAVPFAAPRGAWAWSTIVLIGSKGPQPFLAPAPGDVLSSRQRVRSVVVCVEPQFAPTATQGEARDLRADEPTPPASTPQATPAATSTATPTDAPVVSLPTASPAEDLPVIPPPSSSPSPRTRSRSATRQAPSRIRTTFRPSPRTPSTTTPTATVMEPTPAPCSLNPTGET